MSSGRKQLLLVALTLFPIGAGIVAGMVAARLPGHARSTDAAELRADGLSEQLDLSDDQAQKMRSIWESVREQVRSSYTDAEKLQRARDEEMVGLLNQEQKAKFERISRNYSDKFADLRRKRDQSFASAVEQTRNLLSDEQRQKYDEILRKNVRPDQLGQLGQLGGNGPGDMMGSSSSSAATATTTTQPAG